MITLASELPDVLLLSLTGLEVGKNKTEVDCELISFLSVMEVEKGYFIYTYKYTYTYIYI